MERILRMRNVNGVIAREAATEQFARVCMVDVEVDVCNSKREQNESGVGKTVLFCFAFSSVLAIEIYISATRYPL